LNWNPAYSYAEIPKSIKEVSPLWRVLATPVPRERGLAHISDVTVSDITAVGAKQAFEVAAFPGAPLRQFRFERLDWEAQTAGRIANAEGWSFKDAKILTLDGKPVALEASSNVSGL
jgi:hypothetical protein